MKNKKLSEFIQSWKFALVIFGIIAILWSLYFNLYQDLVNKGSAIADEHCLKVNPLVIERKNKFLEFMQAIKDGKDEDAVMKIFDEYKTANKNYMLAEEAWLQKQQDYLNSFEFQKIIDKQIQEAARFQFNHYKYEYWKADVTEKLFTEKDAVKQASLSSELKDYTEQAIEYEKKYQKAWDEFTLKPTLRDILIKTPPSQCTEENFDFPDTDLEKIFNPGTQYSNQS